jgi:hypothetical protein
MARVTLSVVTVLMLSSLAVAETPWWNSAFRQRAAIELPAGASGMICVGLPSEWKAMDLRVVSGEQVLDHWMQTLQMSGVRTMTPDRQFRARFPRLIRAKNGDLLLSYRVGHAHATSDSFIAQRISTDMGKTWSPERSICDFGKGISSQNVIMLPTSSGRIISWVSRYKFLDKGHERVHQVWAWSDNLGTTWSPWTQFDSSDQCNSYYMTDAIATTSGLLAVDAAFPPTGGGNCFAQVWHSSDEGKTWQVISRLTEPEENLGDEVGLIETAPGEVLCLLRDRRAQTTWRLWSNNGGKTWSHREDISEMVGCLQRPLLTRLDERTILATGRDRNNRFVVAFISRDNGHTFGARHVLESYHAEGGYTGAVATGPREALAAWHSDHDRRTGDPEVKLATLCLSDQPCNLWFNLPKEAASKPVYVYFDSPGSQPAEQRRLAFIDNPQAQRAKLSATELKP